MLSRQLFLAVVYVGPERIRLIRGLGLVLTTRRDPADGFEAEAGTFLIHVGPRLG